MSEDRTIFEVMGEIYRDHERLQFSEREKQILLSDAPLTDVSIYEYYLLMAKLEYSDTDCYALKLRRQYGSFDVKKFWIEKLLSDCGLDKTQIRISDIRIQSSEKYLSGHDTLVIFGFPLYIWCMLYGKKKPPFRKKTFFDAVTFLNQNDKQDLVPVLLERYKKDILRENKKFVKRSGLPSSLAENCKYPLNNIIDGLPLRRWQLLNDSQYVPQKTHLIMWIRQFEQNGESDIADDLRDRFDFILNPVKIKPILTDRQIEKSRKHLRYLLSKEYTEQLINGMEAQKSDMEGKNEICS